MRNFSISSAVLINPPPVPEGDAGIPAPLPLCRVFFYFCCKQEGRLRPGNFQKQAFAIAPGLHYLCATICCYEK